MAATLVYLPNKGVSFREHIYGAFVINALCKWSPKRVETPWGGKIKQIAFRHDMVGATEWKRREGMFGEIPTDPVVQQKLASFIQAALPVYALRDLSSSRDISARRCIFRPTEWSRPIKRVLRITPAEEKAFDTIESKRDKQAAFNALGELLDCAIRTRLHKLVFVLSYGSAPQGAVEPVRQMLHRRNIPYVVVNNHSVTKALTFIRSNRRISERYRQKMMLVVADQLNSAWPEYYSMYTHVTLAAKKAKVDINPLRKELRKVHSGNMDASFLALITAYISDALVELPSKLRIGTIRFGKIAIDTFDAIYQDEPDKPRIVAVITPHTLFTFNAAYVPLLAGATQPKVMAVDVPVKGVFYSGKTYKKHFCILI